MTVQRFTVASSFTWSGLGLHSGKDVTVTVHPGEAGLWFRSDSGRWEAIPANVSETSRCTRLGEVSTIEHLMSALAVHEVTDAEIEVTGGELPAIDGSAKAFYDDLTAVGSTALGERTLPDLFSRVFLQDELVKIAIAKGVGRWRYEFSRENRWPFHQEAELESFDSYGTEIAPARTFGFEEEVPAMIAAGLARGLDKSSALVIKEDGYRNDALFENEPARHKLLDLIGDLYLSGVPVRYLDVVGERSGHRTNVEAAHRLRLALGLSR